MKRKLMPSHLASIVILLLFGTGCGFTSTKSSSFASTPSTNNKAPQEDTQAPIADIAGPAIGSYINANNNSSAFLISGSCSEEGSIISLSVDGTIYPSTGTCNALSYSVSIDTTSWRAGDHNVVVSIVDSSGNRSDSPPKTITYDVDAPTPPGSILDGSATTLASSSPVITYTEGIDSGTGILKHQVRLIKVLDSSVVKDWSDHTNGSAISGLSLDNLVSYRIEVRAIDNAGNISSIASGDGFLVNVPKYFEMMPAGSPSYTNIPSNNIRSIKYDSGKVYISTDYGFAVSNDYGATWRTTLPGRGLASNDVQDVFALGDRLIVSTFSGSYLSIDGGINFTNLAGTSNGFSNAAMRAAWYDGQNYFQGSQNVGAGISINGGASFTVYKTTTTPAIVGNGVSSIFVSSGTYYVGTGTGLSVSSDLGSSWTNFTTAQGIISNSIRKVFVESGKIYLATSAGLSVSSNGGLNWTNYAVAQGLANASTYDVKANGLKIYVATDSGLSISLDGGSNWSTKNVASGLVSANTRAVEIIGNYIFVGTTGGLSVSADNGITWTNKTTSNMLPSFLTLDIAKIGGTLWVGTNSGVGISTNNGTSWSTKSTSNGIIHNTVNSIQYDADTIYLGTGGGLSYSLDSGASWTNKTTTDGLVNNNIKGMALSGSTLYIATAGGLSITSNRGGSWTNVTTTQGLPSNNIKAVSVDGNSVCLATDLGMAVSLNGGSSWSTFNTSVTNFASNDVRWVHCSQGKYFAATASGLSISEDGGATWVKRGTGNGLFSNLVLWVSVKNNALFVANISGACSSSSLAGENFICWNATNNGLVGGGIRGVITDELGKLWFATGSGVGHEI